MLTVVGQIRVLGIPVIRPVKVVFKRFPKLHTTLQGRRAAKTVMPTTTLPPQVRNKIGTSKACMLGDLYQQSQSGKI